MLKKNNNLFISLEGNNAITCIYEAVKVLKIHEIQYVDLLLNLAVKKLVDDLNKLV